MTMLGQKLLQKGERALHFEKLQEIPFCQKTAWCPVFFAKKKHWSENDMLENDGVSENRSNFFPTLKKNPEANTYEQVVSLCEHK